MREDKLKPCPFCGGEALIRYFPNEFAKFIDTENIDSVECIGCFAELTILNNDLSPWNTRHHDEASRETDTMNRIIDTWCVKFGGRSMTVCEFEHEIVEAIIGEGE